MIRILDLAILVAASIWLSTRELFFGVLIFSLGILFEFQIHRTRLLIGKLEEKAGVASKIKAGIFALIVSGLVLPIFMEDPQAFDLGQKSHGDHWMLPVIVLIGLLSATMMIALAVERRRR